MMSERELEGLISRLLEMSGENEIVEFKQNYHSPEEIGERISAVSNSACLLDKPEGYLLFGVEDSTAEAVGTDFNPKETKVKNQELENWLSQRLNPSIDFRIIEPIFNGKHLVLFVIPATKHRPVRFFHTAYIRIGSYTRKLSDFPEKENEIWNKSEKIDFESDIALSGVSEEDITGLLDTGKYFDLLGLPYPTNRRAVIEKFISEKFVKKEAGKYSISNLGGLLFAKKLSAFPNLKRKIVRVIVYRGNSRIFTEREIEFDRGYACGFDDLIARVDLLLPASEEIAEAYREEKRIYPVLAVRELTANMLIHQDLSVSGTYPRIEIFDDRIEFTNPGLPMMPVSRFIDEFQSRNDKLASFLRRINICEEKGSGIDKVVFFAEQAGLPAPKFHEKEKHTSVTIYAPVLFSDMERDDKIRAAYQHACLCYVSNKSMTNKSLRERFSLGDRNTTSISRLLRETVDEGLIKESDPAASSKKFVKYIPFWA